LEEKRKSRRKPRKQKVKGGKEQKNDLGEKFRREKKGSRGRFTQN